MRSARTKLIAAACAAGVLAWLGAGAARAAQLGAVTVSHDVAGYRIAFDAVVDAPARQVYAVLSDYAAFVRMNPAIVHMSVEPAPAGSGERVRSVIRSCIWFFCKKVVSVEDVTEPDPQTIVMHIVPGRGDFERGSSLWRVTGEGARTRLHYEATRVASFWIPPLIGPWAIKRTLEEQLQVSMNALEVLARQKPSP